MKMSCREIANACGEETFRALEKEVLSQLKNTSNAVIALGGGLILDRENAEALAKMGQLVYLQVSKQTLKKRIFSRGFPPISTPPIQKGHLKRCINTGKPSMIRFSPYRLIWKRRHKIKCYQELCTLIEQREHSNGQ